ncbi:MAG: sodium pump decarboxylase subunit gamma [Chloroflexi bacterium]|nr:sodium pump decarboxylase subunit gamma [Chloroflexota bacterium]
MSSSLALSLQITLVGMSLVFAAIILLWGLMSTLMRLTADRPQSSAAEPAEPTDSRELKRRAAVAAVAVALAVSRQSRPPPQSPLPPTAHVSPWQSVMRANQLKQRGPRR